jgi:vacuolar-type H+-ATPase subunit F/Vma7
MKRFKDFIRINEGGNLTVNDIPAQKIDMTKSGRKEFVQKSLSLFKKINKLFKKEYGEPLWINEKNLDTGKMFNGSTSFIFSPEYTDEEILAHKTKSGDIDIIIPKEKARDLWKLLEKYKDKEILPGIKYIGSNRSSEMKLGNQINSIFMIEFDNGYRVPAQVDFEMLDVSPEGEPDEFAKFSHSSSFEDAKIGLKGYAHKMLLRALASNSSMIEDIIVITPSSTKDKYKVKTKGGEIVTKINNAKFSVDKGLRFPAYEKQDFQIDGKDVYKEIPPKESTYEQKLEGMFEIFFGKKPTSREMKDMWSFAGLSKLIKRYLSKKEIQGIYQRLVELAWDKNAQQLERDSAEIDYQIKNGMVGKFEELLGIKRPKKVEKIINDYYKKYGK